MIEQALVFSCQGDHMLGVLSPPSDAAHPELADAGVVIIVGGPQYRAGSHRQFVQLARSLARQGVPALRFDTRGMGDSSGEQRTLEAIEADIGAAIDALQAARPQVRRVVLWGLCGGASAALLYWRHAQDLRVQGMVLVNPWVRTEESEARTRLNHYYLRRLGQRDFWTKLFTSGVGPKAATDLLHNIRVARRAKTQFSPSLAQDKANWPLQHRMAQAWHQFAGPKLLILSGEDFTAKEFIEAASADEQWRANLAQPSVTRFDVEGADHTFSDPKAQRAVEDRTWSWLLRSLTSGR